MFKKSADEVLEKLQSDEVYVIGLDKQNKKISEKLSIFSYPSVVTNISGAQKNRLIETFSLITHHIYFG